MVAEKNSFQELMVVIDRLLAKDGCPWDREQTVTSLSHMLLEEVCEAIDAISCHTMDHLSDELGDVLVAALFFMKAAEREKRFCWDDPLKKGREKLIRRHPHIFEKEVLLTPEEVLIQWEELKKKESAHKQRKGKFDGISTSLPALAMMQKLVHIAKKEPKLINALMLKIRESRQEEESGEKLCAAIASLILQVEEKGIQIEQAMRRYFASCKKALDTTDI